MISQIEQEIKEVEKRWQAAKKNNEALGEGLKVGKVIRFPVADGHATYEIIEIGDNVSKVKVRNDLDFDNYRSDAVDSQGRILTSVLENQFKRQKAQSEIFK